MALGGRARSLKRSLATAAALLAPAPTVAAPSKRKKKKRRAAAASAPRRPPPGPVDVAGYYSASVHGKAAAQAREAAVKALGL